MFRAAILYVVIAVGVVEIADIVVPYIGLPDVTVGVVFAAVVLLFPVALVLAWAYDVSGPTVRRTEDTPQRGHRVLQGAPPDGSLAVLPFDNVGGTEAGAPLTAGLHGDLLTALSKVPGLTVIARRSVLEYGGTTRPPREIGRELGVATLLEGAVQSSVGRVRLNVELIDAATGAQRWAESYDRELSAENLFQIQTDLAARITDSLQAQMGGRPAGEAGEAGERPAGDRGGSAVEAITGGGPVRRLPTTDLEAYRWFARGQDWLGQRTGEALIEALDAFRAALDRDPEYAPAWAGIAEVCALLRWYDFPIPDDAPEPRDAARRALRLDPTVAEAHTSRGILHALRQDAAAAHEALERAVDLGPGYAEAHIWLAWIRLVIGRAGDALEPARRALELSPRSPVVRVFLAETLLAAGRPDEARPHARRARELEPGFAHAHYLDAVAAYHQGEMGDARQGAERALGLIPSGTSSPRPAQARAVLALALLAEGDEDRARSELATIQADGSPDAPFGAALILAASGDPDAACEALARVRRWGPMVTEEARYLFPDILDPLRADPRYRTVIDALDRSWNMPEE